MFSEPDAAEDADSDEDARSLSRRVTSLGLCDSHDVDVHHASHPGLALDCIQAELTEVAPGQSTLQEGVKETPYTPTKSPMGSNNTYNTPAEGQQGGGWGNGTGRKRGQSEDQGDQDNGGSGGGSGDNDGWDGRGPRAASQKKQKMEDNQNLSCPFRKRNPTRFNVRDYHICATRPFSNMSVLK
jgi:hypothetical protein